MRSALLIALYSALWALCMPLLALSSRLRQGFFQRVIPSFQGPFDLWIQAASGGEAYLALELVNALTRQRTLSILVTTCTAQGLDILGGIAPAPGSRVQTAYLPFDLPAIMSRAVRRIRPSAVVLLETELWPGLLWACSRSAVPVIVVNGRMRAQSLHWYRHISGWLERIGPRRILAASEEYAQRFGRLFGNERVETMANIKFDRVRFAPAAPAEVGLAAVPSAAVPLDDVLGRDAQFVVLGSVRAEEEESVLGVIEALRERHPLAVIGLFPRHLHRVPSWERRLAAAQVPFSLRSTLAGCVADGYVVLWDRFGELASAYARCKAAFVGGSLAPLGGQNFLEPLAFGVAPCIGPHWDNFSWIGREILSQGLVREVDNTGDLVHCLGRQLEAGLDRQTVRAMAEAYVGSRRGGTETACRAVLQELDDPGRPTFST
jgi:3-deoxy-D-manno-octulosonic-acid transferase